MRRWLCLLAVLLCVGTVDRAWAQRAAGEETPIDRYVAKPDASYQWKVVHRAEGPETTTYVIEMVSQTWRTPEEVNRTEWKHWVNLVKPKQLRATKGMLFITGGSNDSPMPEDADEMIRKIAAATGSVVTEIKMVPNQPLVFANDGRKRFEDDFIGYTWDKYLATGDETWPARLPMVKSAVRALDTIEAFLASEEGGQMKLDGFLIAGASKRGWTTWMTAAVDKRVVAIAPIVIDVLNVRESMMHHHDAYGFWAPAINDYVRHKITERMNSPENDRLMAIEDPYRFRHRFTMPKYLINAAGDEFFLPDSSRFYWDDLVGEKHIRYVPNVGHSLKGSDAREGLAAFYDLILRNQPRPEYTWSFESDGAIRVTTKTPPREVHLWQATNPKSRDFRIDVLGKAYKSAPLAPESEGVYVAHVKEPPHGFTAYFVELVFDTGSVGPLKVTSGVRIVPDVLPHKDSPLAQEPAADE
ncbi:MAG: PhoPQ-activated pathogenicity-related family protein [Pirellulales bacterium]|nr:PhoPQ-activated pathogenicity-related family protein [Pirellulales bacterium]